jgi:Transposase IS4
VLYQSSVYHGNSTHTLLRKRPKETSTSAKTARVVFGKEYQKLLEIPEHIDDYNHRAKAVDQGDQLKCYTPGLRPIKRGGWQSIFHWLLNTVLVNSYLLSFHSDVPESQRFRTQYAFRKAVQRALFEQGERVTGKRKRS